MRIALNDTSIAGRWFLWSADVINKTRRYNGTPSEAYLQRGTNLCKYFKITMLWTPLVLALHTVVYGAFLYVTLWMPTQLFGGWGAAEIYLRVFGAIVAFIAFLALFVLFDSWRQTRNEASAGTASTKQPGIFSLLWMQLVAMKQRVCPLIEFKRS